MLVILVTQRVACTYGIAQPSIHKHQNDVLRLFQVIDPEAKIEPPLLIPLDKFRSFRGGLLPRTKLPDKKRVGRRLAWFKSR